MKNKLPEKLTELMTEKGITKYKLAKELQVSDVIVGKWCKGEKQPVADNLLAIAIYFDVTTDYLLGLEDE